ncbi:MAG TPA: extracellular solute-binding protein [Thermomicrobiales bacterium]|nr:extracellular solute-binding protein [Thermomicrobiales bacterium]
MVKQTRRSFVGSTAGTLAGAAAATSLGAAIAEAAPAVGVAPVSRRAQDDRQKITFYHIFGTPPGGTPAASPAPMIQVIDAFNAQSTTTFIESQTPSTAYAEVLQKAQADIAAGNAPDLVITPWSNLNYADEGLGVIDLGTVGGDKLEDVLGNLRQEARDIVTKDDRVLGLPWGLSTPIVYYNADVFKQAGVDPETALATWDAFKTDAPKLQEALGGNPVIAFTFNKDWPAQTLVQCNGGRIVNDDGTFGFTSDEAKAAMQMVADLDKDGLYDRSTSQEIRPNFVSGATAVFIASVASLKGLRNDVAFTLGTAPWPTFADKARKASTGGSFIGVYTRDESHYAGIWEFFTFCTSQAGYEIWNQTGYINISTHDFPQLDGQAPAYTQFEEGLIRETNWPGARGLEAQTTWATFVERIWANDISVDEGVSEAESELSAIVG